MQLNPSEISDLIKKRIEGFEATSEARSEGTIVSLTDGIVRIHGLADVMQGEMIDFGNNLYGMALNLERDSVGAVVLGDYQSISEGDKARCTGRILEVPVGEALLGRVLDPLGRPLDGMPPPKASGRLPAERPAPTIIERDFVSEPIETGLLVIDALFAIPPRVDLDGIQERLGTPIQWIVTWGAPPSFSAAHHREFIDTLGRDFELVQSSESSGNAKLYRRRR